MLLRIASSNFEERLARIEFATSLHGERKKLELDDEDSLRKVLAQLSVTGWLVVLAGSLCFIDLLRSTDLSGLEELEIVNHRQETRVRELSKFLSRTPLCQRLTLENTLFKGSANEVLSTIPGADSIRITQSPHIRFTNVDLRTIADGASAKNPIRLISIDNAAADAFSLPDLEYFLSSATFASSAKVYFRCVKCHRTEFVALMERFGFQQQPGVDVASLPWFLCRISDKYVVISADYISA
ncbi:hypothetical protein AAVH_01469 [Aphelenchoides avenae]|nr:hypothetical protein AAVH_01469 [Aphelenchus avenae]